MHSLISTARTETFKSVLDRHGGVGPGFDLLRIGLAIAIFYGHAKWIAGSSTGWVQMQDLMQQGVALQDAHTATFDSSFKGSFKRAYHLALVPMFFALSGFLVSGSAFRTREIRSFLAFRALRIFPALSVEVTLSALILGPIFTTLPLGSYFSDPQFFRYFGNIFGFVRMLLPGVFETNYHVTPAVNANLWTLPGEFYSYLITSALIVTGLFFRRIRFTFLIAILTLVALLTQTAWGFGETRGSIYSTPVVVYYFMIGCLFYHWRDRIPFSWPLFIAATAVSAIALAFPRGVFIAPVFLTYATLFVGISNWPRIPLLQSGDYSYGIYLYGFPISQALIAAVPALRGHENWFALAAFLLTLGFAVISWIKIEKPTLKLKRLVSSEPRDRGPQSEWIAKAISIFDRPLRRHPIDFEIWHKCSPIFPRRTTDDRWTGPTGQIWRRLHKGQWQYRQDPETDAEWEERNTSGF